MISPQYRAMTDVVRSRPCRSWRLSAGDRHRGGEHRGARSPCSRTARWGRGPSDWTPPTTAPARLPAPPSWYAGTNSAAAGFDHEQSCDANSSTCRAGPGACLGRGIADAENCSEQIAVVPLGALPSALPVGTQAAIGDQGAVHPTGAPSYAALGPGRISIARIGARVPNTAGSSICTSDE